MTQYNNFMDPNFILSPVITSEYKPFVSLRLDYNYTHFICLQLRQGNFSNHLTCCLTKNVDVSNESPYKEVAKSNLGTFWTFSVVTWQWRQLLRNRSRSPKFWPFQIQLWLHIWIALQILCQTDVRTIVSKCTVCVLWPFKALSIQGVTSWYSLSIFLLSNSVTCQ